MRLSAGFEGGIVFQLILDMLILYLHLNADDSELLGRNSFFDGFTDSRKDDKIVLYYKYSESERMYETEKADADSFFSDDDAGYGNGDGMQSAPCSGQTDSASR